MLKNSITTSAMVSMYILLCIVAASCGKDPAQEASAPALSEGFEFNVSVLGNNTRTDGMQFTENDTIGIFAIKRITNEDTPKTVTQEVLENAYGKNIPYVYDKTTLRWRPADNGCGIIIPHDNSGMDFYAYFPYDKEMGSGDKNDFLSIPVTITDNQALTDDFGRSDMLYGTGNVVPGRREVSLTFRHLLTMVRLNIIAEGIDEDNIETVCLKGKHCKFFFDFTTGGITLDKAERDTPTTVTFNRDARYPDQYIYQAILVPQPVSYEHEDFEILFNFAGLTQGYTSRFSPKLTEIEGGTTYFPEVTIKIPPARVKVDIEQLVAEMNSAKPETWTYAISNEGRKLGEICKEYVRATPYAGEDGNVGVDADAQMIVAYPMASNGKDVDMLRGIVLAVLKDDADGNPTGQIDYTAKSGGEIGFYTQADGTENAVYVPGSRDEFVKEFYIYNRTVSFTPPVENGTAVSPIIRTRLIPAYLTLAAGDKYGIVKVGCTHMTKQDLRATLFADGTPIRYAETETDWRNLSGNVSGMEANTQLPLYSIRNGVYYYNKATVDNLDKIVKGWIVPDYDSPILTYYLGGVYSGGKYMWTQTRQTDDSGNVTVEGGNNKSGLGLEATGFIQGYGTIQTAMTPNSYRWLTTLQHTQWIRCYCILPNNNINRAIVGNVDGVPIRLIRVRE